ncbi:sigma-54-dependent transcriptional regulator [Kangiella sediminilitoris]|uniref:Two component, sigma54 specific, transcriptional regulator, Fis family n=1 Tax=Kangiella sediminilitoris TaxID=1144748 RepID=A0A1B3BB25_9GAMM|nr:sigma-54 dependent transcriptional regulator [Kangiella sediminilitoris]AOE49993.1 Two component, sigma54 specific, transcriptional regulator, Fis family [Kangiella sediminilitoris]
MAISQSKVLLIDDEADIRHLLTMTLIQMKLDVVSCKDLTEAKKVLKEETFEFCLTDLKLPDGNGLDMVSYCRKNYPNMPIAVITAYSSTEKAIEAMKLGAFDFLSKPIDLNHLRQLLKHAFKFNISEQNYQKDTIYKVLTGDDSLVTKLRQKIGKVKSSQAPVVIQGDAGTEKEALAQIIHRQSSRSEQASVTVDFEAHSKDNHEQILFFNDEEHKSYLLKANHGTLILSNLHLLSNPLQKRLLQVIEERQIVLEQQQEPESIDLRVIVCTEQPLTRYVELGILREDLFFRLNVITLELPGLNERHEDFELIVNSYLNEYSPDKTISPQALNKLKQHKFLYNYRELENVLFKAATLADGNTIDSDDLILVEANPSKKSLTPSPVNERGDIPLDEYLEAIEKKEIEKALEQTRWNRTEAAKLLKISFRTIRYKMSKFNIE